MSHTNSHKDNTNKIGLQLQTKNTGNGVNCFSSLLPSTGLSSSIVSLTSGLHKSAGASQDNRRTEEKAATMPVLAAVRREAVIRLAAAAAGATLLQSQPGNHEARTCSIFLVAGTTIVTDWVDYQNRLVRGDMHSEKPLKGCNRVVSC
uniref:Uncharacterized protein n=1 Tax=Oryza rufipogon TaxID=4529 RepID=A0A0E0NTL7_ORYRU